MGASRPIRASDPGSQAVWLCGCALAGKTRLAQAVLQPLGFRILDVDQPYEELSRRYPVSHDVAAFGAETLEAAAAERRARRVGERLAQAAQVDGCVDPARFLAALREAVDRLRLDSYYACEWARRLDEVGRFWRLPFRDFRRAMWPRLDEHVEPDGALKALWDSGALRSGHLSAVARALTERAFEEACRAKSNLVFVETGGRTSRLIARRTELRAQGYRTLLVFVDLSSVELALLRNQTRSASSGRTLTPDDVRRSFGAARRARPRLVAEFHPDVMVIDNSLDGAPALRMCAEILRRRIGAWLPAAVPSRADVRPLDV